MSESVNPQQTTESSSGGGVGLGDQLTSGNGTIETHQNEPGNGSGASTDIKGDETTINAGEANEGVTSSSSSSVPVAGPGGKETETSSNLSLLAETSLSVPNPINPLSGGPPVPATTTAGVPSASSTTTTATAAATTTITSSIQRFPIIRLNALCKNSETSRKGSGILLKSTGKRSESTETTDCGEKSSGVKAPETSVAAVDEVYQQSANKIGELGTSAGSEQKHVDLNLTSYEGGGGGRSPVAPPIPSITPAIVKPRRPSVHFAMDSGTKSKAVGVVPERMRQDSGGSGSRKHRSRKEKLVCRSESPSPMPMDTSDDIILPSLPPVISTPGGSYTTPHPHHTPHGVSPSPSCKFLNEGESSKTTPVTHLKKLSSESKKAVSKNGSTSSRMKPRVKRLTVGGGSSRNSKKSNAIHSPQTSKSNSLKESPPVKKKKVIEIVSPGKRKSDHLDIVKSSSDPIFIRAANKPFKLKNKPSSTRFKFSRANLHKPSNSRQSFGSGSRIRFPSSSHLSSASNRVPQSKQRSPQKKEESELPTFPPAFIDDLMWLMTEAEKEFGPISSNKQMAEAETENQKPQTNTDNVDSIALTKDLPATTAASRLLVGRRRVESEPSAGPSGNASVSGFDITPNSPTGVQPFSIPKDAYFSPSPSYAATTTASPSGKRRYSRRRHAKIHPPIDDTNCNFQGHFCPNPKFPRSLYCEKHLDQGIPAGYIKCRYTKDGRQCRNLIAPSFDTTVSFCENHANLIARSHYEQHNPKIQPDATNCIVAKLGRIFQEGLISSENENDTSTPPDIFSIVEDQEKIQTMALGKYTGGLIEELDVEGERNVNPYKPDYETLRNAGYYTTEEIIQIHISKLRRLKALYQREKELEGLTRQHELKYFKDCMEKLKDFGPSRFTTNPYLINTEINLPLGYIEHQIKEYDTAKAILQSAYKADGQRSLLRLKVLQKQQELARKAKASGQKQHDATDMFDSDTDGESDDGESRENPLSSRCSGNKSYKCSYNEGYAVSACQNPPVTLSNFCLKHILSDKKQVQWVPCNRKTGPDPQDVCKTPCFRILEKHGCPLHTPLILSKHKPVRSTEDEISVLVDSDNEEEELTLENESHVLANLVADECLSLTHLNESINRLTVRGSLDITDPSDSEETDEEGLTMGSLPSNYDEVVSEK